MMLGPEKEARKGEKNVVMVKERRKEDEEALEAIFPEHVRMIIRLEEENKEGGKEKGIF